MTDIEQEAGPEVVTAITGKPLASYERYVDMLSHVMGNGLALAADRAFLLSLDPSVPIYEAARHQVRESIRWRFARDIDEIEALGPATQAASSPATRDAVAEAVQRGIDERQPGQLVREAVADALLAAFTITEK